MILHRPDFRMLCVDPGLRGCGVAEFLGGDLVRAAYVKNTALGGRGYTAQGEMGRAVWDWVGWRVGGYQKVVVEHPRVYPGSAQQKGDLNDLLDVTGAGSAVASFFYGSSIESVFPGDWKGQVEKSVMTARISRSITQEERSKLEKCPASLMHNQLDAVGIGLWRLGRLNKRVIHNT